MLFTFENRDPLGCVSGLSLPLMNNIKKQGCYFPHAGYASIGLSIFQKLIYKNVNAWNYVCAWRFCSIGENVYIPHLKTVATVSF